MLHLFTSLKIAKRCDGSGLSVFFEKIEVIANDICMLTFLQLRGYTCEFWGVNAKDNTPVFASHNRKFNGTAVSCRDAW